MNQVFIDRFTDPTPIAYEFITGPIAQLTDQQLTLQFFGPNVGSAVLNAFHGILNLVGADCHNLDVYSYGTVQVDSTRGTATITLKDENGNIIRDQLNPTITCTKTFETAPLSSSKVTATTMTAAASSKPLVNFPTPIASLPKILLSSNKVQ